jgi:hypothetical protein
MKINIEVRPADIEAALNWASGLIGAAVDKKVAALQRQEAANPLLALHQRETFAFEHALARARRYSKSTGRLPKGEEFFRLYSFLIPASRILPRYRVLHKNLLPAGFVRRSTGALAPGRLLTR